MLIVNEERNTNKGNCVISNLSVRMATKSRFAPLPFSPIESISKPVKVEDKGIVMPGKRRWILKSGIEICWRRYSIFSLLRMPF